MSNQNKDHGSLAIAPEHFIVTDWMTDTGIGILGYSYQMCPYNLQMIFMIISKS